MGTYRDVLIGTYSIIGVYYSMSSGCLVELWHNVSIIA